VWGVKQFRPYLLGEKCTIITDHRVLTWFFNIKDPGSRLARWRLKLEEYEYEIQYKPGTSYTNADALSRIHPVVTRSKSTPKTSEISCMLENPNTTSITENPNISSITKKFKYKKYDIKSRSNRHYGKSQFNIFWYYGILPTISICRESPEPLTKSTLDTIGKV